LSNITLAVPLVSPGHVAPKPILNWFAETGVAYTHSVATGPPFRSVNPDPVIATRFHPEVGNPVPVTTLEPFVTVTFDAWPTPKQKLLARPTPVPSADPVVSVTEFAAD
jgi:hypothetical protein